MPQDDVREHWTAGPADRGRGGMLSSSEMGWSVNKGGNLETTGVTILLMVERLAILKGWPQSTSLTSCLLACVSGDTSQSHVPRPWGRLGQGVGGSCLMGLLLAGQPASGSWCLEWGR